jgi:hypothetical protein
MAVVQQHFLIELLQLASRILPEIRERHSFVEPSSLSEKLARLS